VRERRERSFEMKFGDPDALLEKNFDFKKLLVVDRPIDWQSTFLNMIDE
jgi:hypothetical protein